MRKHVDILKKLVIKSLLISLLLIFTCTVYAKDIVIVYPNDGTIVNSDKIHIIGYVNVGKKLDIIIQDRVYKVNSFQKLKTKDGMKYVFMKRVLLNKGENNIRIVFKDIEKKVKVKYVTTTIAYRDKIKRKTYFHMDDNKSLCTSCHSFVEVKDCQICHSNKMNYKYVHGPVAAWQCFQCHDKNNYYSSKQPISSKCLQCHEEFQNSMFNAPYAHGPTVAGYCNICHDPHGSNRKYLLMDDVNNLCLNCHTDKKSGTHVLANFTSASHPTSGKLIPDTNEEISCISCHNPHYGQTRQLFQNNSKDFMSLCISCHKDKV
ncbi:cytochrome C [Deferribacter autotrophicus]|uniref:Cytochrome C n=1 Tax=Deferribacter autotrophicus TaxID=500465 RepID=A0A5A8F7D4_9BACT|nr:cytochrome c3 family protein [Deferribacter autotrophicus]KAA0258918.1 cytochrome C [Deferribacter autotrophicus]